jgi:hypothetical protein
MALNQYELRIKIVFSVTQGIVFTQEVVLRWCETGFCGIHLKENGESLSSG